MLTRFDINTLSADAIELSKGEYIIDEKKFVASHTAIVEGSLPDKLKKPYIDRLNRYYELKKLQSHE